MSEIGAAISTEQLYYYLKTIYPSIDKDFIQKIRYSIEKCAQLQGLSYCSDPIRFENNPQYDVISVVHYALGIDTSDFVDTNFTDRVKEKIENLKPSPQIKKSRQIRQMQNLKADLNGS